MKFHVVQVNEKIQDISRKYNISVDEIIKLNRHINNMDMIVPGMKIRLPILSDEVSDQLKDSFLDIEKYYPKIEDFKDAKINKKNEEPEDQEEDYYDEDEKQEQNYNNQTPVYQAPNPYYQFYQNIPYQQPYQQPIYQNYQQPYPYQQYQMPQQNYYQMPQQPMNYQEQPMYARDEPKQDIHKDDENIKPIDVVIPNEDYTSYWKLNENQMNKTYDEELFSNKASCLDEPKLEPQHDESIYQPYSNFFQNPLFNPPYPCSKPIEEIDQMNFDIPRNTKHEKHSILEFDEEVKEIKVDLRDFVKKHTKIKKKKDTLDLL